MEHHDLGISPKLSALLAMNYNQATPTSAAKRKPAISESEERERVELAKIYFQRVFASSQKSDFDGLRTESSKTQRRQPKNTSPLSKSILKPAAEKRTSSIEQCFSAEISNQDERCRRELVNVHFYHLNSDISDGSQCSIEPNSSVDADAGSSKPDLDFAQSVFSADNSCNAVDTMINTPPPRCEATAGGELSFGGIIDSMSKAKADEQKQKQQREKEITMQLEQNKMQANEQSPDLFEESDDDEDDDDGDNATPLADVDDIKADQDETMNALLTDKRAQILKSEKVILGQIQASLSGLLPPPSVTILQYDILELLSMYKQNVGKMTIGGNAASTIHTIGPTSEFAPSHSDAETQQLQWPHCMDAKTHGIYYNRSLCSENIELLAMRYAERNIGAETSSTFNAHSPSSCKKRSMRLKLVEAWGEY